MDTTEAIHCIPPNIARSLRVYPIREEDGVVFLMCDHKLDPKQVLELQFRLNKKVNVDTTVDAPTLDTLLDKHYPLNTSESHRAYVGLDCIDISETDQPFARLDSDQNSGVSMAVMTTSTDERGDRIVSMDDVDAEVEFLPAENSLFRVLKQKRSSPRMFVIGDNVVDLEARLQAPPKGGSVTLQWVDIPKHMGLRIHENGKGPSYYCGSIDVNNDRIRTLKNGLIRIPVDDKYDLGGGIAHLDDTNILNWQNEHDINSFLENNLLKRVGGGGAHNNAFGQQVFLDSLESCGEIRRPPTVSLATIAGEKFIENNLPRGIAYHPIFGFSEAKVPWNVNISLDFGLKLTFRSSLKSTNGTLDGVKRLVVAPDDVLLIDSVKNRTIIDAVLDILNKVPELRLYLAATDSMVKALGRDKMQELAIQSSVYVSNEREFQLVMEDEKDIDNTGVYPDDVSLYDAMKRLAEMRSEKGTIWVTQGEIGATVMDENGQCYFQSTPRAPVLGPHSKPLRVTNTNGCGDAFCAIVTACSVLHYPVPEILDLANAAGHLSAFEDTAAGHWMATMDGIRKYRNQFESPKTRFFNVQRSEFVATAR